MTVEHAEEGDNPIPETPVLFSKFPTAVTGPESAITWDPEYTEKVDYETELVVVLGREAHRVDRADAFDHVAGYLVGNDVSARDLQHGDGWVRGRTSIRSRPSAGNSSRPTRSTTPTTSTFGPR